VRLRQRLDGFVSLDAGGSPGRIITKPLTFTGDALKLNAVVVKAGALQVAILDEDGAVIPGFSLDECDIIRGDSTSHRVAWKSQRDLSELAGKAIRLQFQMRHAKLYAMEFD
jgi:hypothetical protein